jgi:FtsH-binding integral membrane protein
MKKRLLIPSVFIVVIAFFLICANEFTMFKVSPWFSYMLIISSMLMGFWISKSLHKKSK